MKNLSSYFYKPQKRDGEIAKKRRSLMSVPQIIWKAVLKTCTVIGAMILLSALVSTILVFSAGEAQKPLPDKMVLVFNLEEGISEVATRPSLLDPFPFISPTLHGIVKSIHQAKNDDRVKGIVFRLNGAHINIAHIQEIRDALMVFNESEKFTKIYAPSYIDAGGGLTQYFLASAFDEIWMQPIGMFSISGPSFEMPFAKNAMDKMGVKAEFFTREEFKSAMENFTNAQISNANEKMLTSIIGNLSTQMMGQIAYDRNVNITELARYVDQGLLTGEEALKYRLIDRLNYPDILLSEMRGSVTGDPESDAAILVSYARYRHAPVPDKTEKDVALIYVSGTIIDESEAPSAASGSEIAGFINEAAEDDSIEAILLRVDSPGGSPSASETIRRAVVKAKEKGKKVVVSMGATAASGGYWVAADADKIIASRGTLTGSIGVLMGKFEASALWENVGVNWEGPQMGANADIWSMNQPFNARQRDRMTVLIDETYNAFLDRVAKGRKMSVAEVRNIAKGRVWTGEQARSVGLVDEIGGLEMAKYQTAKLIGLNSAEQVNLIRFPEEGGRFEQLLALMGEQVNMPRLGVKESAIYKAVQPYLTQINLFAKSPVAVYDVNVEAMR